MANLTLTKKQNSKSHLSKGKLPTKRYINLAEIEVNTLDKKTAIAAIIVIIAGAVIFSIYGVAARFAKLYDEQAQTNKVQQELNEAYDTLAQYDMTEEEYAHYTFAGMTDEELSQVEREEVLELLDETVIGKCKVEYWTVSENVLELRIVDSTLKAINEITRGIDAHELVSYTTVSTAQKEDGSDSSEKGVTADVVVHLNGRTHSSISSDEGVSEDESSSSLTETVKDFSGKNAIENGEVDVE